MTPDTTATARHLTVQCQFCASWNRIDAERVPDRPKCGKCGTPFLLDRPFVLTEESFARTIGETEIPVFVDFYADWCGPCKMMAPSVDALAQKYQGRALVAKLNTDYARETSAAYQIQGIPTVIVFSGGQPVVRQSGAMPLPMLERMLGSLSQIPNP